MSRGGWTLLGWKLVLSLPVILAIAWLAGRLLGVSRSWAGTVLAGLVGQVGLLSVMLLGTQGGPRFTGDTSLFQFFGYSGLFCATVLILRVIVAILRDGLN